MNLKKNLVFLGMMGSGKSSIGNLVSKKLNIKFIDVDNIIEDMMGMSISSIFQEKGEEYFRNLEEKITLKNLKLDGNIIALGGGGFINEKIRKEILNNHLSFWLTWEDSIIIKRIKAKGIEVNIYEPLLSQEYFYSSAVITDLKVFKSMSDTILTNRMHEDLSDVKDKVFTRDIFRSD